MDYAGCLANLGSLYQKKEEFPKAVTYFERGLQILEKIYDGKHMDIATCGLNMAGVRLFCCYAYRH